MDAKDQLIQQLLEEIKLLKELVEQQSHVIKKQTEEIEGLKKRLNQNSNNSSKPPSSDGLKKPTRTSSLREKHQKRNIKPSGTPSSRASA